MIYKIANLLRDQIEILDFVEISAGLVKPTTVRNNATIDSDSPIMEDIIIPVAYNDLELSCEDGELYALVPDSKKMSLVWWEDLGIEPLREDTYYYHVRANLRCVGWWNLPLINSEYTDPGLLVANLIATIPVSLPSIDYLSQIQVMWTGEQISGSSVLNAYNFNIAEDQIATFPYAVTGLDYAIEFAFGKNCVDEVILNPKVC